MQYLPLLACPIGMALMMWMMTRKPDAAAHTATAQIDQLRAEVELLRIERGASPAGRT
jgi:hypothetical protein